MKAFLSSIIALCLLQGARGEDAAAQAKGMPTIFVAPLDGDMSQIQGWQPALGQGLAEMLITELSKLNKFQVLESTGLKDLADEIKLGETGYVSDQEKVDKGGWAGSDFMFRGKVTRFGSKSQGLNLGGFVPGSLGNVGTKVTTSDVRIDWRIVDTYTRKIITTGQAVGTEKGMGFNLGVAVNGNGGNIGFNNQEFMNSALGKATVKAVNTIMEQVTTVNVPESGRSHSKAQAQTQKEGLAAAAMDALKQTPGKVIAVVNKTVVIVSLGSKSGFKSGDKLKLYETVDTKDDKGNVVFTDEKLAGEITLDSVQEERSKAIYAGDAEVKSGWIVKAR